MNERIINRVELKSTERNLVDVSERTSSEITELCKNNNRTSVRPRGLFVVIPERTIVATEYIDNGCRGGWSNSVNMMLGQDPVMVRSISANSDAGSVELSLAVPDHNTKPVRLTLPEIFGVTFLEDADDKLHELDDRTIKQTITSKPFASHTAQQLAPDMNHAVHVRACSPLAHPVSVHQQEDTNAPCGLDEAFKRIDSYVDELTGQVMTRVIVASRANEISRSTDWVPLDDLEFYTVELCKQRSLYVKLYEAADALLKGATKSTDEINRLLGGADAHVYYPLAYDTYRDYYNARPVRAPFVLGHVATNNVIRDMFAPILIDESHRGRPAINASRILLSREQPWVIDDTINIASPLLNPSFNTGSDRWLSPIETVAIELMGTPEQSL